MTETITIEIKRYRDPQGKPTCADGDKCQYLKSRSIEVCMYDGPTLLHRETCPETGWIRAHEKCPVWADQKPDPEFGPGVMDAVNALGIRK